MILLFTFCTLICSLKADNVVKQWLVWKDKLTAA